MDKKAQLFMPVMVVVTLILCTWLLVIMNDKKDNFEKNIGERQLEILKNNMVAQKAMLYIDQGAVYAERQAQYDLASMGGFIDSGCGEYMSYPLWKTRDKECWPVFPEDDLLELLRQNLNDHLIRYDEIYLPINNYQCKIDEDIYCLSIDPVLVSVTDIEITKSTTVQSSSAINEFAWPSSTGTVVTSCVGPRNVQSGSLDHNGIDLRAVKGSPVFAIDDGVVTLAKLDPWGTVTINHGNGIEAKYLHNSALLVKKGDLVTKGYAIARAGNTAPPEYNFPVHIHFEARENGKLIDPIETLFSIEEFDIHFKRDANCVYNRQNYAYKEKISGRIV